MKIGGGSVGIRTFSITTHEPSLVSVRYRPKRDIHPSTTKRSMMFESMAPSRMTVPLVATLSTCVQIMVVDTSLWPRASSAPACSTLVAKPWHRV